MKTHLIRPIAALLCWLLCILSYDSFSQTTWIANANAGAPAGPNVFTGTGALGDAITAASDGDIIYVVPSSLTYLAANVTKSVTIFGGGIFPQNPATPMTTVSGLDLRADNIRLSGLTLTNGVSMSSVWGISNILIERCRARTINFSNGAMTVDNIIVQHCILGENANLSVNPINFNASSVTNAKLYNNIIYTKCGTCQVSGLNGASIENNVFTASTAGTTIQSLSNVTNSSIKNNIFYQTRPAGGSPFSNNVQENNLSFGAAIIEFDDVQNISVDNIEGQDPLFVNFDLTGTFFRTYDLNLQDNSPAKGAGYEGTDMGISGGIAPFDPLLSPLPAIQSVTAPAVVGEGSNLMVRIKASGN